MRDYRRGVLLGLSLAEVFILLLFCFLLLIAPRLIPEPEGRADKQQPEPLTSMQQSGAESFVEKPLTLDGRELTLGLTNDNLSPIPLAENPAHDVAEINDSSTNRATNSEIAAPDASTSEEASHQRPQGDDSASDNAGDLSGHDTTASEESADEPRSKTEGKHDWPPIIPLREAEGYKFDTGSAEVSPDFDQRLRTVVKDAIIATIQKYPAADVIDVVGHTDERPINGASNLDASLIAVLSGDAPAEQLSSADNVGLGMARATAVAVVLRSCPELTQFKIIPYSGGQIIEPGDRLATGENSGDRGERRRIEIKIRGSNNSSN